MTLTPANDTIAALATAPGTGGIAIVRISGPDAEVLLKALFVPARAFESHRLYYGHAVYQGETLDECMAVLMRAPRSYTREDVAELHLHGGDWAARSVLSALYALGARAAEPGEFTRRAFLNGRLDLSQAEAVMALISAEGGRAARAAVRQLGGGVGSFIEKAQEKIESNNFGIRKNLLEYDQVMNEQREIIYEERRHVLDGDNMRDSIFHMMNEYVENVVDMVTNSDQDYDEWNLKELNLTIRNTIPMAPITEEDVKDMSQKELKHMLKERAAKAYEAKESEFPEPEHMREIERVVLLKVIDAKWMDHIDDMDQLRQGIGLQAYGQRDPKVEYKMIGYEMFDEMTRRIEEDTVRTIFHVKLEQKVEREQVAKVTGTNKDESAARAPKKRVEKKIYPNDPCPCGSGKKYKQCCGRKK